MKQFVATADTINNLIVREIKEGHLICQFKTPISFMCRVGEQDLVAEITHAEDDGKNWKYHVSFSDSHKSIFFVGEYLNDWKEKGQSIKNAYAKAISTDFSLIYQFDPWRQPFWLPVKVGNAIKGVWVKPEPEVYAIFFDGDFRFFCHNFTGRWQAEIVDQLPTSYIVNEIRDAVFLRLGQSLMN